MKAWAQILALIAQWIERWRRGREQRERQERDDKVADDPGNAFDNHFGGVPRADDADAADQADADDDRPPK